MSPHLLQLQLIAESLDGDSPIPTGGSAFSNQKDIPPRCPDEFVHNHEDDRCWLAQNRFFLN